MTPKEYASIHMDTTPTTRYKAEKLAEFFSLGCMIYILKDLEDNFKPSWTLAELEDGLVCVEVYQDGKVLERPF